MSRPKLSAPLPDVIGKRFRKLTILAFSTSSQYGNRRVLVRCDCGITKTMHLSPIVRGACKSCGCIKRSLLGERARTHGLATKKSHAKVYNSWRQMVYRCTKPNCREFRFYGGRGISVCDRWTGRDGLIHFIADMGNPPSPRHSIDRINNNGNYCPENCRWATQREQTRNYRRNLMITCDGKTQCIADWAKELACAQSVLRRRMLNGWSHTDIIHTPIKRRNRKENQ